MSDRLRRCASCKAYTLSSVPVCGVLDEVCRACSTRNVGNVVGFPLMDSEPMTPAASGRWRTDGNYVLKDSGPWMECYDHGKVEDAALAADVARRLNAGEALERENARLKAALGIMLEDAPEPQCELSRDRLALCRSAFDGSDPSAALAAAEGVQ